MLCRFCFSHRNFGCFDLVCLIVPSTFVIFPIGITVICNIICLWMGNLYAATPGQNPGVARIYIYKYIIFSLFRNAFCRNATFMPFGSLKIQSLDTIRKILPQKLRVGRPEHVAIALHTAATIHFQLKAFSIGFDSIWFAHFEHFFCVYKHTVIASASWIEGRARQGSTVLCRGLSLAHGTWEGGNYRQTHGGMQHVV